MRVESLRLTNFRNFASASLSPSPGINIFYGGNGAGKSNLLEAIYTLCLGRSQRGAKDVMLIHRGENDYFRLEGICTGSGEAPATPIKVTCAFQLGGRKKITIDDNPASLSRLYRLFGLISMAPEDVTLLSGPPSSRRRFLDLHLSQASPSYMADLIDYNKALAQKNSFLKNSGGGECPFDPLLIDLGSRLMKARHGFIHFLQTLTPEYYHRIAGDAEGDEHPPFALTYRPNVPFETPDDIASAFAIKLAADRRRETIAEMALVGPHRDDIDFDISGFPARGYGSMGELRSAVVAVMLAAASFLENRQRQKPLLLLDEIFAELDESRRHRLAELLKNGQQIFLTTAVDPPEILSREARIYRIVEGTIEEK